MRDDYAMKRIASVQPQVGHKLKLRFHDGVEGVVDLSAEVGKGIFEAWRDERHFASVKLARGGRALEWPGEIDLCADALYLEITGKQPAEIFPRLKPESAHA